MFRFFFLFGVEDNGGRELIFEVLLEGMLVYLLVFGWSLIDSNVYVELFFYIIDGVVIVCFYSVGYGNFVIVLFEIL